VAFKTESGIVRTSTVATSSKPRPVGLKPCSVSESPAEFVKNQIPGPLFHLELLIQYEWGEPQETAHGAGTQVVLMKMVQREKTAFKLCPPTRQDIQSP